MSELLKTESGAIATAIARGDELARRGKYRRAIQIWRELLDLESEEAVLAHGLIRNKIASSYFRLSRRALRAKKGKAARKAFLKAAERLRQALKYEETPEYYVELGRCYLNLGDGERADDALQKALAASPGDEKARYYAAIAKLHLEDIPAACELIERSPSASPRRGWWIRLRALADALAGEIPKALTALSDPPAGVATDVWFSDLVALARASTPSPKTAEALDAVLATVEEEFGETRAALLGEIAGDTYAAMGMYEQAVQLWADASRGAENGRSLVRKVGLACESRIVDALRMRDVDQAAAWYRLGVELGVEEAIKPLEGLIDFYLGKSAWSRGDFKEAADRFAACLRRRASVDAAALVAIVYEAQGDWVKAANAWSTVYELAADRPGQLLEAARRQGLANIRAGSFDKAASALRRFLDIEADDEIFLYLGCCLIQINEWKAAIDLFEQATREVGDRPKLLVGLAVATELAGRSLEEQVRAWRRAAHSSEEAWVYHVWRRRLLQLAHERLNSGAVDQALECYVSLLVEDIDDGESWMWCGAAHLKTGRLDRALKCFNAALDATGSAKVALFAGGELLRAGDEEEAARFFQKAVRLDPQSGTELEIARFYHESGKKDAAAAHLRKALDKQRGGDRHVARIAELAVKVADADLIRSVMLEALKTSDEPAFAHLLLAAQEIKLRRWDEAKEALRAVEQAASRANDMSLAADAVYFQKALERAVAYGRLDLAELREREEALAARWVELSVPARRKADERADLLAWARRQLYIAGSLDPADAKRVETSELPLPAASMPALLSFGEPLPVHRLLAFEPHWSESP